LSLVAAVGFEQVVNPHGPELIVRAFRTPATSPEWNDIARQLRRSAWLVSYIGDPLAGFVVGAFVGLLQKRHTLIVAAACLAPDVLYTFFTDRARLWSHSVSGILNHLFVISLPFMAAVLAAAAFNHWTAPKIRSAEKIPTGAS
jgi:hypothetical protein